MASTTRHAQPTCEADECFERYARLLAETRELIQKRLSSSVGGHTVSEFFQRGKMLRAILVFASADAATGRPESATLGAVAIEMLHGASLLHDDIIDQAVIRRGMPALHQRIGTGPAIVLGDEILLEAFAVLSEARQSYSPERLLEAMDILNRMARLCCGGQFRELSAGPCVDEDEYLGIVYSKTAAPFIAAGALGVLLAGGTATQLERICSFARDMGTAYQIRDDLLDIIGDPNELGKPGGNSLVMGRPMLPLIHLRRVTTAPLQGPNGVPREDVHRLLEDYGILERSRTMQEEYLRRALGSLEGAFEHAEGVQVLRALVTYAAGSRDETRRSRNDG